MSERQQKLTTTKLTVGYRESREKDNRLACNLDLALEAGEFVCLLGPNGAGKSTLIRTLAGMHPPLGGTVHLDGLPLDRIPPRERARQVSVVLTEPSPSGMMDAYALVSLGRHPYSGWFGRLNETDRKRIKWAFDAVGATTLAHRQVSELSDGERQRVSIARALAQEAGVMILDEPTAFLDLPGRMELMDLLRRIAHRENLALLISTHDLDLALRFADRLWILTAGGTLFQGPPEALALSGELADAFSGEHLDWDATRGSFRAQSRPEKTVRIEGEGTAALWTRRAVERLGYGETGTGEVPDLVLRVRMPASWIAEWDRTTREFSSLEELIDWLRQV